MCRVQHHQIGEKRAQIRHGTVYHALKRQSKREPYVSGRASYWDANTVRKWTSGNLRTKTRKCVPTKRNRETHDAFHHRVQQTILRRGCALSLHNSRVPSRDRLRRFEIESRFLRTVYAMIILPILTTYTLIHFSLQGWENVLYELWNAICVTADRSVVTRTAS